MEVSVRELKNKLSAYLRRVAAGETLIVTSHKRPVARILPLEPAPMDEGEVIAHLRSLPWLEPAVAELRLDFEPVKRKDPSVQLSDIVLELRD